MPLLPTRRRRKRATEDRPERSRHRTEPAAEPRRPPIVELRDATVVYPGGQVALERVTFGIQRGEFVFVVGPTGCGKSTLIRTLTGEVRPASGEVLIAGHDINRLPKRRIPHLRRRIGTVFQDFKLLPNRTVYDNVAYTLKVTGASRSDIRRKVPEILRLVGLQTKVHSYPDQLSGGEQQRVSIARAFVNHPPLLLADEPTGNLDPETSIGIMQLLYRINRTGTTVLVVTHDREMVDKMRRRVLALDEGRLVRDEATATYHEESTTEFGVRVRAEMGVVEGHTNGEPATSPPRT
jgi:cell division transport system ATP-binding protein